MRMIDEVKVKGLLPHKDYSRRVVDGHRGYRATSGLPVRTRLGISRDNATARKLLALPLHFLQVPWNNYIEYFVR